MIMIIIILTLYCSRPYPLDKRSRFGQLLDFTDYYGTCDYDGLYREGQIQVGGFDGADDYDIHKGGERCYWSNGAWIDYKNNYLYITQNAAKAYNPDYRIKLTPTN